MSCPQSAVGPLVTKPGVMSPTGTNNKPSLTRLWNQFKTRVGTTKYRFRMGKACLKVSELRLDCSIITIRVNVFSICRVERGPILQPGVMLKRHYKPFFLMKLTCVPLVVTYLIKLIKYASLVVKKKTFIQSELRLHYGRFCMRTQHRAG